MNKEALGFEVRNLMMPEQIVNQVKSVKGVEKVGEEKVDGRDAIKYRYGATTDTQTKAGEVSTESYIFVDKETGFPLRSETNTASNSAQIQGVKGLKLVTELNNIKETAEPTLFEKPADYKEVQPEEIRQQVNTFFTCRSCSCRSINKSGTTELDSGNFRRLRNFFTNGVPPLGNFFLRLSAGFQTNI